MLTERQTRIGHLARSNKVRLSSDNFLNGLSAALGRLVNPDSLLPISASDSVRVNYSNGYQRTLNRADGTYREIQPSTKLALILAKIKKLENQFANEAAFLLPSHFESCVQVAVGEVLSKIEGILQFDRDTLMLASSNGADGLMLDWNPDDNEETYEFAVWGAEWPGAMA